MPPKVSFVSNPASLSNTRTSTTTTTSGFFKNTNNKHQNDSGDNNNNDDDALLFNVTTWDKAASYERAEALSALMNHLVFSRLFSKDAFDVTVLDEVLVCSGATHLTAASITEEIQRQALLGNVGVKATLVDPEQVKLIGSRQMGVCIDGFVSHNRRALFEKVLETLEERHLKGIICKVRFSMREGDMLPEDAMLFPLFIELLDVKVKRFWNRAAWGVRSGLVHQIGEVRRGVHRKAAQLTASLPSVQLQQQKELMDASFVSKTGSQQQQNPNSGSGQISLSASMSLAGVAGVSSSQQFSPSSSTRRNKSPLIATNAASLAASTREEVSNSATPASRRKKPFCSTNEYYVAVTQDGLPINRIWLGAFPTLFIFWASWDEDSMEFLRNWYGAWDQGESFFSMMNPTANYQRSSQHQQPPQNANADNNNSTNASADKQQQQNESHSQQVALGLLQQDPWFLWASRFLDPADFDFHAVRNPAPPIGADDATVTKHIQRVLQRASLLIGELHTQQQNIFQQQQKQQSDNAQRTKAMLRELISSAGIRALSQVVFINCDLDKARAMDAIADLEREYFTAAGRNAHHNNNSSAAKKNQGREHQNSSSTSRSKVQRKSSSSPSRRKSSHSPGAASSRNASATSDASSSPKHDNFHVHLRKQFHNSFVRTSHYWLGADSVQSPLCEALDIRSFPTLVSTTNKGVVHFVFEFAGYEEAMRKEKLMSSLLLSSNGDDEAVEKQKQKEQGKITVPLGNSTIPLTKPNQQGGDPQIIGKYLDRHVFVLAKDFAEKKQRRRLLRQQQLMQMKQNMAASGGGGGGNLGATMNFFNNTFNGTALNAADLLGNTLASVSFQEQSLSSPSMSSRYPNQQQQQQQQHFSSDDLGANSSFQNHFEKEDSRSSQQQQQQHHNKNTNELSSREKLATMMMFEPEEVIRKRGEAAAAVRAAVRAMEASTNSQLVKQQQNHNFSSTAVTFIENEDEPHKTSSKRTTTAVVPVLPWHLLDEDLRESIITQLRLNLNILDTPVTFEAKRIWCFDEASTLSLKSKNDFSSVAAQNWSDHSNSTWRFLDRCMIRTKKEIENGYVDWTLRRKAWERKLDNAAREEELKIRVRIPDEFDTVARQVSEFYLKGLITEIAYSDRLKPLLDLLWRQKKCEKMEREFTLINTTSSMMLSYLGGEDQDEGEEGTQHQHLFHIDLDCVMCCKPWQVWHANLNNPLLSATSTTSTKTSTSATQKRSMFATKNEIFCNSCKKSVRFCDSGHFECLHCRVVLENNNNNNHDLQQQQNPPPTVLCWTCGHSHNPAHIQAYLPSGNEYNEPIKTVWGRDNVHPLPQKRSFIFSSSQKASKTPFTDLYYQYEGPPAFKSDTNNIDHEQSLENTNRISESSSSWQKQQEEEGEGEDNAASRNAAKTAHLRHNFSTTGLHTGVFCDSCRASIKGVRWKCAVCYDIDLCDVCFNEHVVEVPKWGMMDSAGNLIKAQQQQQQSSNTIIGGNKNNQTVASAAAKTTATAAPPKPQLVSCEEQPSIHGHGDSRDGRRRLCHFSHVFLRIACPPVGGGDGSFILPEVRKVTPEGLMKL